MNDYRYTPEEIAGHRAAWYAFLREHPEMQGWGGLHEVLPDGREKMCCLGAGCAVLLERGVRMRVGRIEDLVAYGGRACFPPPAFVDAMGLPSENPLISIGGEDKRAAAWNDNGVPWPEIADALEAAFPADADAIRQAREAA